MIRAELNQSRLRGGQRLPLVFAQKALGACAKELNEKKHKRVSIAFVSEKEMRRLNNAYRGKDTVTDVLSFALDEDGFIGELILSYEQAARQAKQMNHSVRTEIGFLIVHGILHLYGYDHEQSAQAKKMFARQVRILKTLGINPAL
ncbi:rRNA maturation RNase YbeY [Candidatus Uhrbacteria bacterium CG_4_9_14_3_um_filter_50_9]|uniref:Endoribonuclease YbeY n=1 Tax=Candidatus Uhrbacteria bacterium CG_4_9_14_3_um_filter_50_9 TaxID=1975035 RepID=A0A2M7XB43_9BACT|nr:MAG: rRNA maturation RNase YbeY [Candidatus Uhrbacteria bacterium CG_4_9_14_3_um_filter_50_9]